MFFFVVVVNPLTMQNFSLLDILTSISNFDVLQKGDENSF